MNLIARRFLSNGIKSKYNFIEKVSIIHSYDIAENNDIFTINIKDLTQEEKDILKICVENKTPVPIRLGYDPMDCLVDINPLTVILNLI